MNELMYLSTTRYPTEKAYGVTVGNTVYALNKLKRETCIGVWGEVKNDGHQNKIISISRHRSNFGFKSKSQFVAKIAFIVQLFIKGFDLNRKGLQINEETILWTREPIVLLPHAIFHHSAKYLIELHHSVSWISKVAIRFLARKHQVKVLALSQFSKREYLETLKCVEITEIPMGVSENFFKVARSAVPKNFVVGYLGKGTSSGNDNRIDQIVTASKLLENINNINYSFVGLELDYEFMLRALIDKLQLNIEKFNFISHISHSDIPKELANFSVGVIPYPQSSYNDERFPLKAIEYAAAGLPIVATSTYAFRRLLSEDFAIFFEENSPQSFAEAVLNLYKSSEMYGVKSTNARNYAEKFTYEQRAQKIIDLIDSYN
jgi:glycosyltransferase involved in cell wall biosynthesis